MSELLLKHFHGKIKVNDQQQSIYEVYHPLHVERS